MTSRAVGSPVRHRLGDELGSVVTAQHDRSASLDDEFFQVVDEAVCGDGSLDQSAEAFAGVSSTIEQILNALPCSHTSNWKSTAHTTLGAYAAGASIVELPTRLRRRRCGTRSPSSHHNRWIFL